MSLPRTTTAGAAHTRASVSSTSGSSTSTAVRDRARAYLARLPVSVQGQGGHNAAFHAACVLVTGFALSEQEALPLLLEWNAQCLPPWSEAELRHKLRSAAKTPGDKPAGHLLQEKQSFSSSYSYSSSQMAGPPANRSARVPRAASRVSREAVCSARQRPIPAAEDRPAQASPGSGRQETVSRGTRETACGTQALHLEPLTHDDIRAIAALRGILPDAVDLAHRHGFLHMGEVEGQRCYILQEGTFAQARRLDGMPFTRPDGTRIKAKNLPGSTGAFIGKGWLFPQVTHVLLVEGCVGLLEALAAFCLVDMKDAWCILAATSASSRFARDPALLEALRGRHVRIVPDADAAGLSAATSWMADLRQAGISHDAFRLPAGCKDLGGLLDLPESDPGRQRRLKDLFIGI